MRIAKEALTFDDVLLQPAYSEILPRQVDLSTSLTAEIQLRIPIMSSAMDTVTEARLAIALAQEGGIGIIHKNMSIEQQAREVALVKKFESGIVRNPITVTPNMTVREVIDLTRAMGISGVPVVHEKQTVGIVTGRDLRFETRLDAPVSEVMTPQERLVTVREEADEEPVEPDETAEPPAESSEPSAKASASASEVRPRPPAPRRRPSPKTEPRPKAPAETTKEADGDLFLDR